VDIDPEPSIRLITKVKKDIDIRAYSAEGDLLSFAWSNYDVSKQYVAIRKMASTPDKVEQEMTIEISEQNVRIISPKKSEPLTDCIDHLADSRHSNYPTWKTFGVDWITAIGI
jgi:hypothetical protein